MESYIWRALLSESRDLIDDLAERGIPSSAKEIVDRVLASVRIAGDNARYRILFFEEVEVYLEASLVADGVP